MHTVIPREPPMVLKSERSTDELTDDWSRWSATIGWQKREEEFKKHCEMNALGFGHAVMTDGSVVVWGWPLGVEGTRSDGNKTTASPVH